jgi:two-component system phosphate regulon sensor histidine kinase PhoR
MIFWMAWRFHRLIGFLRDLSHAIEDVQPLLPDKPGFLFRIFEIDRLSNAINRLITENIRASEKGREYLEQIQATLGNLREAVVIVDNDHFIRLANDAFRSLIIRTEPPIGRRLESFIQGSDFFEVLSNMKQGLEPERKEVEVMIGKERAWLEVSGASLPDNPRSPENLTLFVLHDITRQKKLEKMRTEFVANVSHELRTPVTIIKGFAETLREDIDLLSVDERDRFLHKIEDNSNRLSNLLQDLLLLTRLESADNVLRLERVSISAQIREVVDNFQPRLNAGQRIDCDFQPANDILAIDAMRFSQVLINLFENALKHGKGMKTIRVQTQLVEEGIICVFEDDGAGIPAKDLPFIFQRFYRVDKGRSRESGGTGLGLSIVKHIMQQHNGDIKAESEPGSWTRFTIFIPFPERMVEGSIMRSIRGRRRYFQ